MGVVDRKAHLERQVSTAAFDWAKKIVPTTQTTNFFHTTPLMHYTPHILGLATRFHVQPSLGSNLRFENGSSMTQDFLHT